MSAARPPRRPTASPASPNPAEVRPGWLLGALGLLLMAALCCAYLSLCFLFMQGQWQLLYRPGEHTRPPGTPAELKLLFSPVQFGVTDAGVSQLSGWWLPATPGAPLAGRTVLYLHDGAGSMSDSLPHLARLHALGCSVFAIDYRGYGASASLHPSEATMVEDAVAALLYLEQTRHIPAQQIAVWGRGDGATIAAEAATRQGGSLPSRLVLEDVNLPALMVLQADPRTHLLPVKLLLRDTLDAGPALQKSNIPKLFLEQSSQDGTRRLYREAKGPKQITWLEDDPRLRAFLADATRLSAE